ncbi:hypothetical protein Fcan01_22389 [Folsomia candida]|uniref:Uncharacterized protein n=1 Tax=Folsomia candida TaxID=158441 RepID=A0A226DCW1_FOLCA|nr:hypothetical protein Fcan01_22389 [Folsomia candida]
MAAVIFKVAGSYAKIYKRFPRLPIEFDSRTNRLIAVTKIQDLLGCIFGCVVSMALCAWMPKIAQLLYLIYRSLQQGHFPTTAEEPFASPMQLLSIAIITFGSGGGTVITVFSCIFNVDLVQLMNGLLNLEEDLVRRGSLNFVCLAVQVR